MLEISKSLPPIRYVYALRTETRYKKSNVNSFRRMGLDGFEVNWADILKRHIAPSNESSLKRCEVLVSHEKPLELKFNKTSEVLIFKFHYGYWNVSGILKHWTNRWYITGSIGFNHMWTNLTWHINFSRLFFVYILTWAVLNIEINYQISFWIIRVWVEIIVSSSLMLCGWKSSDTFLRYHTIMEERLHNLHLIVWVQDWFFLQQHSCLIAFMISLEQISYPSLSTVDFETPQ